MECLSRNGLAFGRWPAGRGRGRHALGKCNEAHEAAGFHWIVFDILLHNNYLDDADDPGGAMVIR